MGVRIRTGGMPGRPEVVCPACGNPIGRLPDGTEEERNAAAMELFEDHVRVCLPTRRLTLRLRRRR